jgi:hypothetical protein
LPDPDIGETFQDDHDQTLIVLAGRTIQRHIGAHDRCPSSRSRFILPITPQISDINLSFLIENGQWSALAPAFGPPFPN